MSGDRATARRLRTSRLFRVAHLRPHSASALSACRRSRCSARTFEGALAVSDGATVTTAAPNSRQGASQGTGRPSPRLTTPSPKDGGVATRTRTQAGIDRNEVEGESPSTRFALRTLDLWSLAMSEPSARGSEMKASRMVERWDSYLPVRHDRAESLGIRANRRYRSCEIPGWAYRSRTRCAPPRRRVLEVWTSDRPLS